ATKLRAPIEGKDRIKPAGLYGGLAQLRRGLGLRLSQGLVVGVDPVRRIQQQRGVFTVSLSAQSGMDDTAQTQNAMAVGIAMRRAGIDHQRAKTPGIIERGGDPDRTSGRV